MEKVLEKKNIVLTRAKDQSVETVKQLKELGANVISFPTIKITTITNNNSLDEIIRNINIYNSIIFTSENAVKSLLEKIDELNVRFDPKAFFVISIGDKTTQYCKEKGFRVDFQSNISNSDSLLKELGYIDLVGRKIFIPGSSLANPKQFDSLEDHGAKINSTPVYTNTVNDIENLDKELSQLTKHKIDLYIFTSPSTFNGFIEILNLDNPKEYFENKNIAVIGPVTKQAIIDLGIKPNIIPPNFTMSYLIKEIVKFYSKGKLLLN